MVIEIRENLKKAIEGLKEREILFKDRYFPDKSQYGMTELEVEEYEDPGGAKSRLKKDPIKNSDFIRFLDIVVIRSSYLEKSIDSIKNKDFYKKYLKEKTKRDVEEAKNLLSPHEYLIKAAREIDGPSMKRIVKELIRGVRDEEFTRWREKVSKSITSEEYVNYLERSAKRLVNLSWGDYFSELIIPLAEHTKTPEISENFLKMGKILIDQSHSLLWWQSDIKPDFLKVLPHIAKEIRKVVIVPYIYEYYEESKRKIVRAVRGLALFVAQLYNPEESEVKIIYQSESKGRRKIVSISESEDKYRTEGGKYIVRVKDGLEWEKQEPSESPTYLTIDFNAIMKGSEISSFIVRLKREKSRIEIEVDNKGELVREKEEGTHYLILSGRDYLFRPSSDYYHAVNRLEKVLRSEIALVLRCNNTGAHRHLSEVKTTFLSSPVSPKNFDEAVKIALKFGVVEKDMKTRAIKLIETLISEMSGGDHELTEAKILKNVEEVKKTNWISASEELLLGLGDSHLCYSGPEEENVIIDFRRGKGGKEELDPKTLIIWMMKELAKRVIPLSTKKDAMEFIFSSEKEFSPSWVVLETLKAATGEKGLEDFLKDGLIVSFDEFMGKNMYDESSGDTLLILYDEISNRSALIKASRNVEQERATVYLGSMKIEFTVR